MSLEQLLPGGLYKSVVEESKNYFQDKSDSKLSEFVNNAASQIMGVTSELVRDVNYLAIPLVIFSKELKPGMKVLGVVAFTAHYTVATYLFPLVFKGANYVLNSLDNKFGKNK